MSGGVRVPLADALTVALELVTNLEPGCERLEVAGSVRRRRPEVGDIELVAIPRRRVQVIPGLLEDETVEVDELALRIDALSLSGVLAPHPTDPKRGTRYSKLVHAASGLQVDLFSTTGDSYGLIWLIRTGPADYSRWLVTEARSRGFHVTDAQLHRGRFGCSATPCQVVATPEERDVCEALGIPFVPPEDRR